jgi:pimeloyl-ACP methyl ester carboxylesterase
MGTPTAHCRHDPLPHPRTITRVGLLTATVLLAACSDDAPHPVTPAPAPWTGERVVQAAGTALQLRIDRAPKAPSSPSFVLLSGLDTPLEVWSSVRTDLSAHGTVFSYDRGGVGRSGNVAPLRSSADIAAELRAALDAAGVKPPYVVVAHSIAGLHARVFTHRYASDVAGLVLVDATHETLLGMMEPEDVEAIAQTLQFSGAQAEVRAQAQSVAQVRAAPLPNVPLLVLTSMRADAGETPELKEWLASLQAEWLTQVPRAEQVRLPVGHMVMLDAPEAVIDAARRVTSLTPVSASTMTMGRTR